MKVYIAGTSGFYEILLIILVVILIFNGLLRNRMMREDMANRKTKPNTNRTKTTKKVKEGEYVDFEEVKD